MPIDAIDSVREDLKTGLANTFTLLDFSADITPGLNDPVMTNGAYCAVAWSTTARHSGELFGIEPTNQQVVIEGVTLVQQGDPPQFRRYVDWSNVLGQLGVSLTGRPVLV